MLLVIREDFLGMFILRNFCVEKIVDFKRGCRVVLLKEGKVVCNVILSFPSWILKFIWDYGLLIGMNNCTFSVFEPLV